MYQFPQGAKKKCFKLFLKLKASNVKW